MKMIGEDLMEKKFIYREIKKSELEIKLFSQFNRYQEITRCWRFENGKWLLKNTSFNEQWDIENYKTLLAYLKNTLETGGKVIGVFEDDVLRGFSSVESESLGSQNQYLQLSSLHVSCDYRGKGIGRKLFKIASEEASKMGAEKLYISANSAEETVAFYHKMGCKEAEEYSDNIVEEEPFDVQLEYKL